MNDAPQTAHRAAASDGPQASSPRQGLSKPTSDLYATLKSMNSPEEFHAAERIRKGQLFVIDKRGGISQYLLKAGCEFADQMAEFGLLRLPMQNCIFQLGPVKDPEWINSEYYIISAWHEDNNQNDIYGRIYRVSSQGCGSWHRTIKIPSGIMLENLKKQFIDGLITRDKFMVIPDNGDPAEIDQMTGEIFSVWLFAFIGTLNGKGLIQHEIRQPKNLNAKREKRSKPPIFGFHWVSVDWSQIKLPGLAAGGSHASPRLHWRRGHIRRLNDDRIVMVRPCLVGDTSGQLLEKAYHIKMPSIAGASQ